MKRTALHQIHIDSGAKMGEFAGYDMPLYYGQGVIAEHHWVREKAGLFDVSHMGQILFEGPGTIEFLEKLTPSSYAKMPVGGAKYSVLTNAEGGIIDDLIVTRFDDNEFFAVINAGCKDKDVAWFEENLNTDILMKLYEDRSLLALQGPKAVEALAQILEDTFFQDLGYMKALKLQSQKFGALIISRLGYTGEDGFEISVLSDFAPSLWRELCALDIVAPIGLAARDTLRLEAGYPLYGHDIDDTTSPVEADIAWVISKANTGFYGAERILKEQEEGVSRKRIGFKLLDRGVAREGTGIFCQNGNQLGTVTSGGHSPILNASIGMAYINKPSCEDRNSAFYAKVRDRNLSTRIIDLPFVEPKTLGKKKALKTGDEKYG